MKLPENVRECGVCKGKGEYKQMYCHGCGGGYFHSMGICDWCDGTGFMYKGTSKAVPPSVVAQIEVMNNDTD